MGPCPCPPLPSPFGLKEQAHSLRMLPPTVSSVWSMPPCAVHGPTCAVHDARRLDPLMPATLKLSHSTMHLALAWKGRKRQMLSLMLSLITFKSVHE